MVQNTTSRSMLLCLFVFIVLHVSISWQIEDGRRGGVGSGSIYQLNQQYSKLSTAKQWKTFDWNFFPNAPTYDINFYNPKNILATGIAIGLDRIFIATPKLFSGVPSTLNYVIKSDFGDSPKLQPYPDWSYSTTGRTNFNCSDLVLISVYRMRIDTCNRLWALDAGVSRSLEDFEVTCPPKLLVIDLNTNHVVRRIDFPKEILRGESLFTNMIIDESTSTDGKCDDVFIYISDTVEPGIIVYDSGKDVTWRLSHPSMYPDPDFAQSRIHNHEFVLMDGIVGLGYDPKRTVLYFQPLATDRIFSITRDVLRAGPIAQNELLNVKLVGKKSSQGIGMTVSPADGTLLFSPLSETAIASWNPVTNKQSVLAYDSDRLQFVADMTPTPYEENSLYIVSSKFHRFFLKNLNTEEVNNRILRIELTPDIYNLQNYYPTTNSLENKFSYQTEYSNPTDNKSPFKFEPLNVINYSINNPFTLLNQGETLPKSINHKRQSHSTFILN